MKKFNIAVLGATGAAAQEMYTLSAHDAIPI